MANAADASIELKLFGEAIPAGSCPACPACGRSINGLSVFNEPFEKSVTFSFFHGGDACESKLTFDSMCQAGPEEIEKLMGLDKSLRALPSALSKFARKSLRRVSVGRVDGGGIAGVIV